MSLSPAVSYRSVAFVGASAIVGHKVGLHAVQCRPADTT